MKKNKGITGSTLKIIAIVAMFIDHFAAILVLGYLNANGPKYLTSYEEYSLWLKEHQFYQLMARTYEIMRGIGRFGFPIFCFLLVEGFIYTGNKMKYAINLLVFAFISEIPFDLGFEGHLFYPEYQNVFFTLFLGLLTIWAMEALKEKEKLIKLANPFFYASALGTGPFFVYLAGKSRTLKLFISSKDWNNHYGEYLLCGAIFSGIVLTVLSLGWSKEQKKNFAVQIFAVMAGVVAANVLKTDYSGYGVLTIAVMYLCRQNKWRRMLAGCVILSIMSWNELPAFLMVIPAGRYNGKRGLKMKYFFYAFYPAHILLLYIISRVVLK